MEENPKIRRHRERMQSMHKDFFALLKWQRKKIMTIMENEPEILIDGDVEKLKKDLEEMRLSAQSKKEFISKYSEDKDESEGEKKGLVIKNLYTEKV